jgi:hypothetical protein
VIAGPAGATEAVFFRRASPEAAPMKDHGAKPAYALRGRLMGRIRNAFAGERFHGLMTKVFFMFCGMIGFQ